LEYDPPSIAFTDAKQQYNNVVQALTAAAASPNALFRVSSSSSLYRYLYHVHSRVPQTLAPPPMTALDGRRVREKDTTAPTLITLWDCCVVCVFFFRSMPPPQRCAVSVRGFSSRSAGARVPPSTLTTTPTTCKVTTTAAAAAVAAFASLQS